MGGLIMATQTKTRRVQGNCDHCGGSGREPYPQPEPYLPPMGSERHVGKWEDWYFRKDEWEQNAPPCETCGGSGRVWHTFVEKEKEDNSWIGWLIFAAIVLAILFSQ